MQPSAQTNTVYNSLDTEATQTPTDMSGWGRRGTSHNSTSLRHEAEQSNASCSNVRGPRDCRAEWSIREKKRKYDIASVWTLEKMVQINLFRKQNRVHRLKKKIMVTSEWKGRKRGKLGDGIDIYALQHLKQKTDTDRGLPWRPSGNLQASSGDAGFLPGSGRSPGEWNATHFSILAGTSHGQRSLAGVTEELVMT